MAPPSDHDQLGLQRAGLAERLENGHQVAGRRAHLVHSANLNMGLRSCSAFTRELGTTTVCPSEKGAGWLTMGSSLMLTIRLPWVTAAGDTRTFWPMTMVPVRELMMTLAAA